MGHFLWVYEVILFIYGCSIVLYCVDFIKANELIRKIAFGSVLLAWSMQAILISYELFYLQNFPALSLIEGIYIYGWLLLTMSFILNHIFSVWFIVFVANVFSFSMFLLSMSLHSEFHTVEKAIHFQHEVLIAHIAFSIIAYGFLTLSFLLAILHLLQYRFLKNKQGFRWLWRLSDLKLLDQYSFSFVKLGVPFLFIGLILGVVWGYISGDTFYWADLKTVGSIIVFIVYLFYLVLRWTHGYKGRRLSLLNSATFLVLLVNFFLFNVLSNFHF